MSRLGSFALIVFTFGFVATANADDPTKDCNPSAPAEAIVAACSARLSRSSGSNNRHPLLWRAGAYGALGKFDQAIADFNAAIPLQPDQKVPPGFLSERKAAIVQRAMTYANKGDYQRAVQDLDSLIPENKTLLATRGLVYAIKGDYEAALRDLNSAIQIDGSWAAYANRGEVWLAKGDTDRALADADKSIEIFGSVGAYPNTLRGEVLLAKGDYTAALAEFDKVLTRLPTYTPATIGRGLAHEKNGDIANARIDYERALSVPEKFKYRSLSSTLELAQQHLSALAATKVSKVDDIQARPPEAANAAAAISNAIKPRLASDRRVALVIGNSAYQNVPKLPNPENDARLVAEILKRTGFESVTLETNLDKNSLTSALRRFADQAENADWAIVYYAGHGMEVGGINYLIPTDARVMADRDISFEAVPLEQVLNAAERAKKLRIIILDACRDNPFKNQMKRTLSIASRSVAQGLAAIEPEAGTLVVYAAKDGETALDGDGANSPFATALIKDIPVAGVEVRRVFDNVRDDVMDTTGRKQKPFSYGSISGRQDFYFVGPN
jgi:tetratricopeptide (TPR) repeat protein